MPTAHPEIKRILARRVIHRGQEYGLSLVKIEDNDVAVSPFESETPSTIYYNGTLRILRQGATANEDWHRQGDLPLIIEE